MRLEAIGPRVSSITCSRVNRGEGHPSSQSAMGATLTNSTRIAAGLARPYEPEGRAVRAAMGSALTPSEPPLAGLMAGRTRGRIRSRGVQGRTAKLHDFMRTAVFWRALWR